MVDRGFTGPVGVMDPSDELRMVLALSWLRSEWVDHDLISETDVCQVQPPSFALARALIASLSLLFCARERFNCRSTTPYPLTGSFR